MSERGQTRTFQHVDDAAFREVLEYHKGTSAGHLDFFEPHWARLWDKHDSKGKQICLLTTCSHAKPYGKSAIHMGIRRALWESALLDHVDIVHVSSAGLIPTESGLDYPFCAYDWNDTEATQRERDAYVERALERMLRWVPRFADRYTKLVAYFEPADDNRKMLRQFPQIEVLDTAPMPKLPWALHHDVDDCLIQAPNLDLLVNKISVCLAVR